MNFPLRLIPSARKIVFITLRVMRFHHAARDEHHGELPLLPGEMSHSSGGCVAPGRPVSASPRLRVSVSPSSGAGRPDGATFVTRCAAALLLVHAGLLAASIPRNAVTIDEVLHLPIGMSYWQRGEFWGYHHNPPLIRLLFALPAVLIDVPIDYSNFIYEPGNRGPDCRLGRDFMLLNQKHYMRVYTLCRLVVAALSVLGGYFVFRWSRELFGGAGALVSLALWTFGPNVLRMPDW